MSENGNRMPADESPELMAVLRLTRRIYEMERNLAVARRYLAEAEQALAEKQSEAPALKEGG